MFYSFVSSFTLLAFECLCEHMNMHNNSIMHLINMRSGDDAVR